MNQQFYESVEHMILDQDAHYAAILDEQRKHEEGILNENNA